MLETVLVGLFATLLYASQTAMVPLFVVVGSALWAMITYLWWPPGKASALQAVSTRKKKQSETERTL
jgi:hypothetical protein